MKDDKELNDQIRSDALTKAAGHNADWVMRALISIRGMEEGVWSGEDITNCVIRFAGKPTDKNVWITVLKGLIDCVYGFDAVYRYCALAK